MRKREATRRNPRNLILGGLLAAALSLALVLSTALGSGEDEEIALRRAQAIGLVDQARAQLTFDLLMPGWLPEGYSLEHIAWFGIDEKLGNTSTAVDAWYTAPGHPLIHVWQTDNPNLGGKDPVAKGEPLQIAGGANWSAAQELTAVDMPFATELSTRLPGGVTISVDSGIAFEDLLRVVQSLSSTPTN